MPTPARSPAPRTAGTLPGGCPPPRTRCRACGTRRRTDGPARPRTSSRYPSRSLREHGVGSRGRQARGLRPRVADAAAFEPWRAERVAVDELLRPGRATAPEKEAPRRVVRIDVLHDAGASSEADALDEKGEREGAPRATLGARRRGRRRRTRLAGAPWRTPCEAALRAPTISTRAASPITRTKACELLRSWTSTTARPERVHLEADVARRAGWGRARRTRW